MLVMKMINVRGLLSAASARGISLNCNNVNVDTKCCLGVVKSWEEGLIVIARKGEVAGNR